MPPELSVVIPAFNESARLGSTLGEIRDFLRGRGRDYEILVVDDGSRDGTADVARAVEDDRVFVLRHLANRGKGAAVRTGVLASQGAKVLICDADLSTPIADLELLEPRLEEADLVLGSRALAESKIEIRQPFYRETMGKIFNALIRTLGVRGFRDTQCGFKLAEGTAARRLCADLTIDRFAYDVELVWLAARRGCRVVEVGVTWANSADSRVDPVVDSFSMLRDVLRFRLRHRGRE